MHLGEFIKNYRKEHGLSMEEFASKAGLSKGYISMLEKNKNPKNNEEIIPSIVTFQKVAEAMGTSITHIMKHVDENQPVALEYVLDYVERESLKSPKYPDTSAMLSKSLEEKVSLRLNRYFALYARSFESSNYNLYHADLASYISMLLDEEELKETMEPEVYHRLVKDYGVLDGSAYGLSDGKTYFEIPDIQGNYSTILDAQINSNAQIIRLLNKLNSEGKKSVRIYAETLASVPKYQQQNSSLSIAAHNRTDIEVTDEMLEHDMKIMMDDDF